MPPTLINSHFEVYRVLWLAFGLSHDVIIVVFVIANLHLGEIPFEIVKADEKHSVILRLPVELRSELLLDLLFDFLSPALVAS